MPQPDLFPASFLAAMITFVVVLVGYRITKRDQRLGTGDSWAIMFFMLGVCSSLFAAIYFGDWIAAEHPNISTVVHILFGNFLACSIVGVVHGLRVGYFRTVFERLFFAATVVAFPAVAVWMLS